MIREPAPKSRSESNDLWCFFPTKPRSPCFNVNVEITILSILYGLYTAKQHVFDWKSRIINKLTKDSTGNDDIVVNKWDATFDPKLNIYDFDFNKIFPGKAWKWHVWNNNYFMFLEFFIQKY